ncbi:TadE/TadG family type IV pilus assembly protein [Massilia cavernae]|uniref:Pilus assembly protein n=1 Tax=Massilia cavernae TaxID=2320864 RepID=A0A418XGN9_9BURK|nr:TadE family protein [Massilia cavernae]RJG11629.1 pilus assembly protein [Massilia cavernae]
MKSRQPQRRSRESGAFAVEFATVAVIFFVFLFGVIEVARAMYMFNTLQEVTRRAASGAATIDYRTAAAKDRVRQDAIFRDSAGTLVLGDPVTDQHIRIDYLALVRGSTGSMITPIPAALMPTCPARNRVTCMTNPNSPSCIRFVRARICDPGDASVCNPVRYRTLVSLVDLPMNLPVATTIVSADTLGFSPGMTPCP